MKIGGEPSLLGALPPGDRVGGWSGAGAVAGSRRSGWRFQFGMRALLILPLVAALGVMLHEGIDRWTAVPWLGLSSGGPLVITIVDGETGKPVRGARVRLDMGPGMQPAVMEATEGEIRSYGGHEAAGYRSAVRDTRRLKPVVKGIEVMAEGYESYRAGAWEIEHWNRPSADNLQADFLVRLRRGGASGRPAQEPAR